jgi:predicted nucleic acid-binding protein
MIVDSSVWIDWLRHGDGLAAITLDRAIRTGAVSMLPVILQEILQGASSPERFRLWHAALSGLPMALVLDPTATAVRAAGLYARCRWAGITIRSANDCLIAASCIELEQPLLHQDLDFERIAGIEPALQRVAVA